jgi:hypothetical protein
MVNKGKRLSKKQSGAANSAPVIYKQENEAGHSRTRSIETEFVFLVCA